MRWLASFLALFVALLVLPAHAMPSEGQLPVGKWANSGSEARYVSPQVKEAESAAIDAFGPFRVLDEHTVALVDITDEASPGQFAAMIAAYPHLQVLQIVEAPGTYDDHSNLLLGRMIRAARLAVEVPDGGSARSGAVELVLSGVTVTIADGAEFAVHAWEDESGVGAREYRANSPEHTKYLSFYRDMGMAPDQAAAFYAMTNSVPFDRALWLNGAEMRRWVRPLQVHAPKLAHLDLASALN